jgi:hypothetical protein
VNSPLSHLFSQVLSAAVQLFRRAARSPGHGKGRPPHAPRTTKSQAHRAGPRNIAVPRRQVFGSPRDATFRRLLWLVFPTRIAPTLGTVLLLCSPPSRAPCLSLRTEPSLAARRIDQCVCVVLAGYRSSANILGQRIRRCLTASPRLAIEVAWLARLRCVDTVEADALPVNLDRVAIDGGATPTTTAARAREGIGGRGAAVGGRRLIGTITALFAEGDGKVLSDVSPRSEGEDERGPRRGS